jgi:uncharacterized membrane protein YkoI
MIAILFAVALSAQTSATPPKSAPAKAAPAAQADAKVKLADLPPAVKATVEAETKNATLRGISKENGTTVYELESLVNGRTRDLMIDSAGKVYLVEEQLDVDKAPAPVKAALEARGRIERLESVMANGKTHYEGQVRTKAGTTVAVEVDADGKPVKK